MSILLDLPDALLTTENSNGHSDHIQEVLKDFWICCISRECSLIGRKEVLLGRAKFGILGDGKEVPQVAMARAFQKGDFRSGYYRDQTFMFALDLLDIEGFFAQLYADVDNDLMSGGRQMNAHYSSSLIDEKGDWLDHVDHYNVSADVSSTASQMARALGLAFASKKYREAENLAPQLSNNGNEVCFCTIGDASTSEGVFWETMNAANVLQVPLATSVWDDGFGISVPREYQTTKGNISAALAGMQIEEGTNGMEIYSCPAWDYAGLVEMYHKGIDKVRTEHIPALFHITEATQPQGHSTSGSHERYKTKERLNWENEVDCIERMAAWMTENGIATQEKIESIRKEAKQYVLERKKKAWKNFRAPIQQEMKDFLAIVKEFTPREEINVLLKSLASEQNPVVSQMVAVARRISFLPGIKDNSAYESLAQWIQERKSEAHENYHTNLYSDSEKSALKVAVVAPTFDEDVQLNGSQILNEFFDKSLSKWPELFAFGEDVGQIGDVNQGFAGLQEKHGKHRVFDTGIREWTIVGQAIGMSMRGLRPIAEMQYLDYLIYAISALSDDLATVRWRSDNTQMAPAIIRTRGHRLEGIWHAGSPMSFILGALRGMYICVPRNMTQAVGMYNTLLQSDDPAVVIECLNGYRKKETKPSNIGEYTTPLGIVDILEEGTDLSLVTYGSCVSVASEAIERLKEHHIHVELIDVQTLIPFDLESAIGNSIKKTNRVLFLDEDFPGGGTAYMMQKVLQDQGAYFHLDSAPVCLSAHEHRTPYGSDGDYFTKPNAEDIVEKVLEMMSESDPSRFIA